MDQWDLLSGDEPPASPTPATGAPGYAQPASGAPVMSRRALREAQEAVAQQARVPAADAAEPPRRGWVSGVVIVAAMVLVAVAVFKFGGPAFGALFGGGEDQQTSDYEIGVAGAEVEVVVSPGDSGADMAKTLFEAGVVASEKAFVTAFRADSKASQIRPGTYRLALQMNSAEAVRALLDESRRVNIVVTIPEGFRAAQVFDRIAEASGLPREQIEAAAADPAGIGLPEEAEGKAEGWLFPATYDFMPNQAPADMLAEMVKKTQSVLNDLGVPRDQWSRTIILASMVEKETKRAEDRGKAARVFENRLAKGWKLQSDATVSYGLQKFDTVWTTDQERAAVNDYNTYLLDGLPKGAICNPGKAAIQAALAPEAGDWMYFVGVNQETGETVFCLDDACHTAAVAQSQQWARDHPDW